MDKERKLKWEHRVILDRAYIARDEEGLYNTFKELINREHQWVSESYADENYLGELINQYAQRAIDDEEQNITSCMLNLKELRNAKAEDNSGQDASAALEQRIIDDFALDDFELEDLEIDDEFGSLPVRYACGQTIELGHYPVAANGMRQAIEWTIIHREDDSALVVSNKILCIKPFNNIGSTTTWEECSLRQWLEEEFYEEAFSAAEREVIIPTRLNNSKAEGVKGVMTEDIFRTTFDKVFLLSADEIEKHLIGTSAMLAQPTDFAKKQLDEEVAMRSHRWWTRSMGLNKSNACVGYGDNLRGFGENIKSGSIGVRPALWMNIKK